MKEYKKIIKIISLALVFVFALSFAGCEAAGPAATDKTTVPAASAPVSSTAATAPAKSAELKGEILIGASCALTGGDAMVGASEKQAMELAVKEINAAGGILGKKLVIDIQDDAGDANTCMNVMAKFQAEKVAAVIGPLKSTQVLAVSDFLKENKMIALVNGTSPKLSLQKTGNSYMFYTRPNDSVAALIAGKYAVEKLGAKKVGIFFCNDDFGVGGKDVIEAYLKGNNAAFLSVGHNVDDKDMTGQILKLKDAGCDVVAVWGHIAEIAIFAKQLETTPNYKPKVIGSSTISQVEFQNVCEAPSIAGWYSSCEVSPTATDATSKRLQENAMKTYNVSISMAYVSFYGDVYLLKDAIERAKSTDSDALKTALEATKNLDVAFDYTCDSQHRMVHKCLIVQLDANKTCKTIDVVESPLE